MKQFYSICCALAVYILCSCSTDIPEESQVGSIAGSVSDRTTGEPVATVNVSINPGGSSTVTGSDGTFLFRNLEDGKYTLTITKTGYNQNNSTISVRAGEPTLAHLLIERIPAVVTADRELLDFGANESTNTLSFNIVNPGYIDLEWEIEERCNWITEIKPAKGTLKYGKTEAIIVVIDRKVLPSGPNEAVIVVRSSNGSSDVKVTAIGAERYIPQINTLAVSGVTSSSATLNGEITNAGAPAYTERGFVYSLNSMPTFDSMLAKFTAPVTENAKYSYVVKGLTLGETYYVRAYAINSIGTAYSSNEINFTTAASSPELTVQEVTDMSVSDTSATFNGTVVNAGDPAYFERGFVYSANSNPTINNTKVKANGTGTGSFSVNVSDLKLNQRYYVRTYAICKIGDSEQEVYSKEEVSFTISTTAPQVSVQDVSNINVTAATATFNGTVVNAGDPAYIERGFVYGTTSNPTTDDTKVKANGTGTGTFSANISELQLNQRYYVRAYVTSKIGENEQIAYSSEQVNFTLASTAPVVTVQDVTNLNVSAGTATFNGTVTNTGTPAYTERGFVYGIVGNPTVDDTKVKVSGFGTGDFSANISGLKLNQQYFVRAYAIYKVGETEYQAYSAKQVTFTLTPTAPTVSVEAVTNTNVTTCTATLNGTITNTGAPAYTERGFVYGATRNPTISDTKVIATGSGTGAFSVNISNLDLNKTYYVRAYAKGTTGIVYSSSDVSFELTTAAPSISVQAATNLNVTAGTATLNGTVSSIGNPAYTERGFVYATAGYPTVDDTKVRTSGTGTGTFTANISGLKLSQPYYVRTYAIHKIGEVENITYSNEQVTFTLTPTAPSVGIQSATSVDVTNGAATLNATISKASEPPYTEKGFVYGLYPNPTLADNHVTVAGSGTGTFYYNIKNLSLDKTYYVRAYATNVTGTVYSSETTVSTNAVLPQVETLEITDADIEKGTATLKGNIISAGTPAYTERGFVYSTMSNPTIYDNKIVANGAGVTGSFNAYATGLPTTEYYVRAYATNRGGVVYGEELHIETDWIELPAAGIAVQKQDIGYNNWSSINSMCENSTLGGYTDWRLPTKEELMILYTNRYDIGGFNTYKSYYSYNYYEYYWSSSYAIDSDKFYFINFYTGTLGSEPDKSHSLSGRCVRTIK